MDVGPNNQSSVSPPDGGSQVRILIADDSPDMVQVVRVVIDSEPDLRCVGHVFRAEEVPAAVRTASADVLLLDLRLGGTDGLTLIGAIRASAPRTRVVIYTGYDDPDLKRQAEASGAAGFVVKDGDIDRLLAEIRQAARR